MNAINKKYLPLASIFLISTLVVGLSLGTTDIFNGFNTSPTHKDLQKSTELTKVTAEAKLVVSKKSNVYHKTWCRYVKKIKKSNKRYFATAKKAKRSGYRACKVCF